MNIREARPEDAAGIARVHVESWRTTYRGIVPQDYLDALSVEARLPRWTRTLTEPRADACTFVAEDEVGEIAGFAYAGPSEPPDEAFPGELFVLYLLAERQRQGIGRRLMGMAAERLAALGMPSMLLWVLAENHPSRRFYEAMGGELLRTQPIEIGGVVLEEVAYGWRDTEALARSLMQ